ncbi:DUF2887 domain-containing protein [Synechococcus elongatus]|uniref:DUF2887 domain-containing protein n=1 Tax=Synechococcus elongatus PCC 11802 TaxID=2283154 RepID=A0AAT9K014_SYNEL
MNANPRSQADNLSGMKTDKLFYAIFATLPDLVTDLVEGIPAEARYRFSAPVVKAQEFRLDGLLEPIEENSGYPTVFLEAQMQSDRGFYSRYFAELFGYIRQHPEASNWRRLLLIGSRSLDLGEEASFGELLRGRVERLYLEDLVGRSLSSSRLHLLKLLVVPGAATGETARAVLSAAEDEVTFEQLLELVEAIVASKLPQLEIEEIHQMLGIATEDLKRTRFYQGAVEEGEKKGRQEGRQEGELAVVIRLLTRRFGLLPEGLLIQIQVLSVEQLEALTDVLLDVDSLATLEAWLQAG